MPGSGKPPGWRSVLARAAEWLGWPVFWLVLVLVLLVPTACFLLLAVSPRLFGQGTQWFTLSAFPQALQGIALRGIVDSLVVGVLAAVIAATVGAVLALVIQRTTVPGRRFWTLGVWAVLLVPSYIVAVGWQVVLDRGGILSSLGFYSATLNHLFFGPAGYTLILAIKGVPFAYFAIAGPLAGLSRSYEEAARVHGAGRWVTLRAIGPILLPALCAALIIVFAESISDFGTAAVIAPNANFPVATYTLYTSLSAYPADFATAAVIGWVLVLAVSLALFVQSRFLKGRSFAVLGGRSRFAQPQPLRPSARAAAITFIVGFFTVALVVPILGAVASSLLIPFATFSPAHLTLSAYRGLFGSSAFGAPLALSFKMALTNACITLVVAAVIARRLASRQVGLMGRVLDLTLLAAIALPGLVLAAGYIFAYNLPFLSNLGIHLYGTLFLLGMAYLAGALPSVSRVLMGPMAQVQGTLLSAARVHGSGPLASWRKGVLPLLAPSLIWAWLLTFATTFLELPASELLAPPGQKTVSVAIVQVLNKSDLFRGTALSVAALGIDLAVIVVVTVAFRLLAPRGWKRIGARVV
jgi:iron(III) transport system permease protein